MNEEFAIKLKTILDNASVQTVKQQIQDLQNTITKTTSNAKQAPKMTSVSSGSTLAETKEYSAQIEKIKDDIEDIQNILNLNEQDNFLDYSKVLEYNAELERLQNRLVDLQNKGNSSPINPFKNSIKDIKKLLDGAKKFTLSLIGARSVWMAIRKAMSSYLAQNDELKSKIDGMWYALGSMFAPMLEWIVNLFVKLVSYVNVFVKALGFAGINMKNFGKNASKTQKTLASIDEINNIGNNEESNNIDPFAGVELNTGLKDFLEFTGNWIKENLPFILAVAGAFALWKIGSTALKSFDDLAMIFPKLKEFIEPVAKFLVKLGGWILIVAGAIEFLKGFVDALANGVNWTNLLEMVAGAAALFAGLFIVFGSSVAAVSLVVTGIGLIIAGLVDFINTGTLTIEACSSICLGIMAIGIAISLLTGSWIPLLIAGIAAVALFVVTQWDTVKEVLSKVWAWIKEKVINPVIQGLNGLVSAVVKAVNNVVDAINSIHIEIPDWVPIFGGKSFSPHLNNVSYTPIPMLETGTNYVPNDQLAYLHQGEAVIPKKFNQHEFYGQTSAEELNLLVAINEQLIELNKKDTTIELDGENVAKTINNKIQMLDNRNGTRVFNLAR